MKKAIGIGLSAALVLAVAATAQQTRTQSAAGENLLLDVSDWPEPAQNAVDAMTSQYGPPDGITSDHVIWLDQDPWVEIIVRSDPIDHDFPKPHKDVLEQVIPYDVPADKFDELAEFDGSIIVEKTRGTMSARCDKEPMNFLALNLAHDIIQGNKTVDQARQAYADIVKDFMAGDKHPYTQELQFELKPLAQTRNSGTSIIQ